MTALPADLRRSASLDGGAAAVFCRSWDSPIDRTPAAMLTLEVGS